MTTLIIDNGIVKNKEVDGVKIRTMICPYVTGYNRPKYKMYHVVGVTIHDTANTRKGANAEMHARYVASVERYKSGWQASYHFAVDDKEIVQIIPLNEVSWNAGDGRYGRGNTQTVAIEICVNRDSDIRKAEDNAARLAGALLNTYGIDAVFKHQDHSGKYCPAKLLREGRWYDFVKLVRKYKKGTTTSDSHSPYTDNLFRVQVGAYKQYDSLRAEMNRLKEKKYAPFVVSEDGLFKLQTGAFKNYQNAERMEKQLKMDGFQAFITRPKKELVKKNDLVLVVANVLNVRSGAGTTYHIVDTVRSGEVYTIVDEKNGFGKLKSGRGWISLDYARRL